MSRIEPTNFALALSDFLFHYFPDQRGLSTNTVASYSDALSQFLVFCENKMNIRREKITVNHLNLSMVEEFLDWLENEMHCGVSTRNQRHAALNSLFKYLQYKNPGHIALFQQIRAIPRKISKAQSVNHLSVEAVETLIKMPDTNTVYGRRDFMLLSLMYESAARVSEMGNLKISDIRFDHHGTVVHIVGKGNKPRIVPLIDPVAKYLKKYISSEKERRQCSNEDILFCNRSGKPITRAGISYILKKYSDIARQRYPDLFPEKIYPHIMRHSRAMHWLESGIDLQYIKDLLGHADLSTTQIYAQLNLELKRKVLQNVHPINIPDCPSWTDDKPLLEWLQSLSK